MSETKETVDALASEARILATASGKLAALEADIKAKENHSFDGQARFLRGVISTFEAADLAKYQDPPSFASDGSRKRPEKSNPWSKQGWNVTAQAKLVRSIGVEKSAAIAASAGCKIGDTRWNADFA